MRRQLLLTCLTLTPLSLSGAALFAQTAPAGPRYAPWGLELKDMDRSVKPGDDFFRYAEGTWLKTHPIPSDKSSAGYNSELPDEIEGQVRTIVEQAAAHPANATERKVGDFYAAWMDEGGIDARGLAPLKPYLARIDAVTTRGALVQLMMTPGYPSPINIGIQADQDDPTRYSAAAGQARLGLPTRDYYLLKGEKYDAIRRAYRDYLIRIQTLAGLSDPAARADRIIALETAVSQDQWTPERRRDPVATHNPMTRAQLTRLAPEFDWTPTLAAMGLGAAKTVDVAETTAVTAAGKRLGDIPLSTWKEWVTARFISDHAPFLPRAFDQANFAFYSKTLRDVPEQRARWKRGMGLIDGALGEAVGAIYVQRYWSPATQAKADELVSDMRAAYKDRIDGATWMDTPTRTAALAKLASFDPRIGHPKQWIDYSTLKVSRTDPLGNALAADDFQWRLQLKRFPLPVDRGLWFMTPQTVNAYYDPTLNQITVPAAILQPPFFDASADPAVNYAETGATTIGHEMGHGFDDQGRQYDDKGRLRDWWTPATAAKYKVQADRLSDQFDTYEPIAGTHIKGRLTLGENLADLGGLETAYAAYRRYVSRHGEPPVLDGMTGDQRFFLAYAQAWQGNTREGALRAQLLSNPHSPDKYRVNGIVRNFGPWYTAFGVKPGDAMYLPPAQRVSVWGS
ncbi:endothelin-converting enzyme/putative endopeptidase [Sphingomonas gellani]|uniref:Endothelin-converting enzyme/putative endopeptidase n=1 Tax=Sphingomonas gellani TaxID=1166340 RepID=A0A1H8HKQ7_9SPHN|nr:M13 family metallopeptidase [Sphingomonas gellani]SEN56696.1 endothelin-converting enzyme/putative endopeptidase [Sphingomonas gellani]